MRDIFKRKQELIKRDPVYIDLLDTFNKIIDIRHKNKKDLLLRYRIDDPVINDIKSHYATAYCPDKVREEHQKNYPDHWKFFKLTGEVSYKWHVLLNFDFSAREISIVPYTNDEIIWVGSPPFDTKSPYTTLKVSQKYPRLNWLPYPNSFNKEAILADINEFVTPGYRQTNEEWVPVLINASRMNKNDAKTIKKQLWEVIEARLVKGKKPRSGKEPHDEYPELAFLYSLRSDDTFTNYIKWYDLHMGDDSITPKGFNFRQIAWLDYVEEKRPERIEEAKQKLMERTEVVKTPIGEQTLRGVIGEHIQGEDAVEKGIKLVYEAIHRKSYPSKKRIQQELANCPIHGKACPPPEGCSYLKKWYKKFDNRNKWYGSKGIGFNENTIEDPKGERKPAQGIGKKLMGLSDSNKDQD